MAKNLGKNWQKSEILSDFAKMLKEFIMEQIFEALEEYNNEKLTNIQDFAIALLDVLEDNRKITEDQRAELQALAEQI